MRVDNLTKLKGTILNARMLTVVLCVILDLVISNHAFAQEPACQEECRALHQFKTCKKAIDGEKLLTMRVADVSRGPGCTLQILKLKPENALVNNLPEEIEMGFGPCVTFAGKVGDTIQMALKEKPSLTTRLYRSACNPYAH
jgi:hypothetical protein